ncbi:MULTISPECIES: regulatory protein RecX [Algoriphagus]|uniref:Regulatory protein RecX n=1 Tax=Algoriphagus formosus TaxID=2007308 RepID=A0A4R5UY42_9BACT|nr:MULTISPECIES: regulatory protein RecX [Algoriphagus]MCR9083987.1 RecX family transcriptional regulator [Cyclobacteriaceae bacterium]TDK44293.1 RecX family transcriptional regulator [Algoriphagus aquimaris]
MSGWGRNNPKQVRKTTWTVEEAEEKIAAFCAYQERCVWEVRRKLYEKGIAEAQIEKLIGFLLREKFIDEGRYAKAFARGKFRLKKWGKNRIRMELKMRQVPEDLIRKGLLEIDPTEYYDTLLSETEKKWEKTKEPDLYKKRFKVVGYLMQRGFEQDLVQEAIDSLL